jgi:hypothetical protein
VVAGAVVEAVFLHLVYQNSVVEAVEELLLLKVKQEKLLLKVEQHLLEQKHLHQRLKQLHKKVYILT